MNIVLKLFVVSFLGLSGIMQASNRESADKNAIVNPDLIPIEDDKGVIIHELDLNKDDGLAVSTFKELIEAHKECDAPFVLATVETEDNNRRYVHEYGMVEISRYVYGDMFYLLPVDQKKTNPNNQLPIKKINYYIYNERNPSGPRFEYLGSPQSGVLHDHAARVAARVLVRQVCMQGQSSEAFNQMVEKIIEVARSKPALRKRANIFFDELIDDKVLNQLSHKNCVNLAHMCYEGKDIDKNWVNAQKFFVQVSKSDISIEDKREALLNLGAIWFYGDYGIAQKNYLKAAQFFTQAAKGTPEANAIRTEVYVYLGLIHMEGGYGIERNYHKAVLALTEVQKREPRSRSRQEILLDLGKMYMEGGYGIERNDELAKQYFNELLKRRQEGKPETEIEKDARSYIDLISTK